MLIEWTGAKADKEMGRCSSGIPHLCHITKEYVTKQNMFRVINRLRRSGRRTVSVVLC